MKKKIVLGLAIFAAVFVLGGLYLIITIEKTTSTLNNLIELHRVEILREQLLMNARKIQSGLALRHTRSEEALDSLAGNMVQMKNQANKGTGLGLAISKQFIEMHGGTISVEKNPAGGATFRIILPCTQVEEAPLPDQDHRDVRIA